MKYRSLHVLIIGFLLSFQIMRGMEQQPTSIDSYQGKVINPMNIVTLAPVMRGQLKGVISSWTMSHKNLLHNLIPETNNVPLSRSALQTSYERGNQALKNLGYNNLSQASYVIKLPKIGEKYYFMQASGPTHKAINILHGDGHGWEMNKLTNQLKRINTYQTVSRVVGYLRAQGFIEQQTITTFKVPPTYLVQIPDRKNNVQYGACDENSIIIQEDIGDEYVRMYSNPKFLQYVQKKTLQDTLSLIKHVPLWDIKGNGLINEKTFTLGQTDLQQPNNENPKQFFHKNEVKHAWDVARGIEGFVKLFKRSWDKTFDVTENCKILKELLEHDQDLQKSPYWNHIQRQITILDEMTKE